jgi:hypothetical protein
VIAPEVPTRIVTFVGLAMLGGVALMGVGGLFAGLLGRRAAAPPGREDRQVDDDRSALRRLRLRLVVRRPPAAEAEARGGRDRRRA